MKEKRILDALTQVDDHFVEEAEAAGKTRSRLRWGALAACLALLIGVGVHLAPAAPQPTVSPTVSPDLPQGELPVLDLEFAGGSMGFEGLILDPDQLQQSKAVSYTGLPVYRNSAFAGEFHVSHAWSEEELLARAEETAAALGTKLASTEYDYASRTSGRPAAGEERVVHLLNAETDLGTIRVDGAGEVSVFFEPALDLPKEYSFTWASTTGEQGERTLAYLLDRFSALCGLEQPALTTDGDYNIYGEFHRTYTIRDGSLSAPLQALGRQITFSPNEEGQLWIIRVKRPLDAAEEIGVYPICSDQEALTLLLDGSYFTTVPEEYLTDGTITEAAVAWWELTYRVSEQEKTLMPYYRFYVELDSAAFRELPDGRKLYGVYYVPAVEGAHLSGLPVNGKLGFN